MKTLTVNLKQFAKEAFASAIWLYGFMKLFVFDFDVFFVQHYLPHLSWVLEFKFLIVFTVFALGWYCAGTKRGFLLLAYVAAYPFVMLWRVVHFVARQRSWNLAVALLNACIYTVKSIRTALAIFAIYLLLLVHCLVAPEKAAALSAALLLGMMLFSLLRRIVVIFKTPYFYRLHVKVFTLLREKAPNGLLPSQAVNGATRRRLTKKQKEQWRDNLQWPVLFNRVSLFWARRLRDYQKSGIVLLAHGFSVLLLVIASTFCFAAINFAVFRFDGAQYIYPASAPPTFFSFFYFSFNNVVFNSVPDVAPGGMISKVLIMLQYFSDLAFLTVFVSMFVAHKGQRHTDELETAIVALEAEGKQMEGLIQSTYNLSIEQAVVELDRLEASSAKLLLYLTLQLK